MDNRSHTDELRGQRAPSRGYPRGLGSGEGEAVAHNSSTVSHTYISHTRTPSSMYSTPGLVLQSHTSSTALAFPAFHLYLPPGYNSPPDSATPGPVHPPSP
ncbi:hypothetical protein BD626DRAFT_512687 [Schizophyllum amplum]|uniref:Uncharacterized protein n=1 Tax=Schizophyllum amplum TaxID=97359 RepID=A0A550BZX0_9AGAR|nr:hypothetical protein BD626DRAFT_512687 [Auriculariopsis ampla]